MNDKNALKRLLTHPNVVLGAAGLILIALLVWKLLPQEEEEPAAGAVPWGAQAPTQEQAGHSTLPSEPLALGSEGPGSPAPVRGPAAAPAKTSKLGSLASRLRALLSRGASTAKAAPGGAKLGMPEKPGHRTEASGQLQRRGFAKESMSNLSAGGLKTGSAGASVGAPAFDKQPSAARPAPRFVKSTVTKKDLANAKALLQAAARKDPSFARSIPLPGVAAAAGLTRRASVASAGDAQDGRANLSNADGGARTQYGQTAGGLTAASSAADARPQGGGTTATAGGSSGGTPIQDGPNLGANQTANTTGSDAGTASGEGGTTAGTTAETGGDAWNWYGANEAGAVAVTYQNDVHTGLVRPVLEHARNIARELQPRVDRAFTLLTGVYDPARIDRDVAWLAAELPGSELEQDLRSLRAEGQEPENGLLRLAEMKETLDTKVACLSETDPAALDCFEQVKFAVDGRKDMAEWAGGSYRDILRPHYNDLYSDLTMRCNACTPSPGGACVRSPEAERACALRTQVGDAQNGVKFYLDATQAAYDQLKGSSWAGVGEQAQTDMTNLSRFGIDVSAGISDFQRNYAANMNGEASWPEERTRRVWRTPYCLDVVFQPLLADYVSTIGTAATSYRQVTTGRDPARKGGTFIDAARDTVAAYWYLIGCVNYMRTVSCQEVRAMQTQIEQARTDLHLH